MKRSTRYSLLLRLLIPVTIGAMWATACGGDSDVSIDNGVGTLDAGGDSGTNQDATADGMAPGDGGADTATPDAGTDDSGTGDSGVVEGGGSDGSSDVGIVDAITPDGSGDVVVSDSSTDVVSPDVVTPDATVDVVTPDATVDVVSPDVVTPDATVDVVSPDVVTPDATVDAAVDAGPPPERCDGIDNDGDGVTDEDDAIGCKNVYQDGDLDNYGDPSTRIRCSCAPLNLQRGETTDSTDCYDSNTNAHPGSTFWGRTDRGDGSFDYNCDTVETKRFPQLGQCYTEYASCKTRQGWMDKVAECGKTGKWLVRCRWKGINCVPFSVQNKTQLCR